MMNSYKKAALVLAMAGATGLAGAVYAQDLSATAGQQAPVVQTAPIRQVAQAATAANWLNLGQIYNKLEAAGYTDVSEIERERGGYEAKARDSQGRIVKLHVEPLEGRIVHEAVRDREGRKDRRGMPDCEDR